MQAQQNKTQLLILAMLLLFATVAGTDIYISGLPQMQKEFNTTANIINLTISVYNYGQAFFVLFIGVASDLYGRRNILRFCVLIHLLAAFVIAFSHSINFIIFLRLLQSLGSAAVYIVLRLIIKDIMDLQEQLHATGMMVLGLIISPAIAPVMGAWIMHFYSWRACFLVMGAIETILFIWLWQAIIETNLLQQSFRAQFSIRKHIDNYWQILKSRLFLHLALMVGGTFAVFYAFLGISSYMYINQYHISAIIYSYIYIGLALCYLFGNRWMTWLNQNQVLPHKIITLGIIVSVLGVFISGLGLLFDSTWMILGFITFGVCIVRLSTALINPPAQVASANSFGELGAHALGLLSCFQFVFAGLGIDMVSSLSFRPSINLFLTSLFFTLVSVFAYYLKKD